MTRVVCLLPKRAANELNQEQERTALERAGYEVREIVSPYAGVGGVVWMLTAGLRQAVGMRPDIVVCRDLDTLRAGIGVKRLTGAKLVYDCHEIYPAMIMDDVSPFVVKRVSAQERGWLPSCDAIVASNPGIARWLGDQNATVEPTVVMNCRDPRPSFVPPTSNRLCYFGTFHKSRFIREMVQVVKAHPTATLAIGGPRTDLGLWDWVRGQADGHKVIFLGQMMPEKAMQETERSGVVVAMVDPSNPNNRAGLANKMFDAMSVGRAAIGTAGTATGDLIMWSLMGTISMYDKSSFSAAIDRLYGDDLERIGRNAYEACRAEYNWQAQARKLVQAYREVLPP